MATAELAVADVARPLRAIFAKSPTVQVKQLEVTHVDPDARSVTTADGETFAGDYLVLAAGSKPNFFNTPGAEEHAIPLYSVTDAERLRTRVFEVFEEADTDPSRIEQGALNFVIVGAGPTGVETAGAAGRPDQRRDAEALPRTRREPGPGPRRRPGPGRARGVLGQGPRLRGRRAAAPGGSG